MRLGLTVATLLTGLSAAGCSNFRDLFTSHADTAAKVGSLELSSERVADMLLRLGGPNVNPQAGELLTSYWVDLHLLGRQVAEGTFKTDSSAIAAQIWPQLNEQKIQAWHDTIVSRRPLPGAETADSVYQADQVRVLQHILFAPGGPSAADTARAEAEARRVLPQAKRAGAEAFGRLAAQYSADGSKTDAGFLPPYSRDQIVPEFSATGFALAPGQVSDPVKTQFGWHIIRRPTQDEVRQRLQDFLRQTQSQSADSIYMSQLSERHDIKVSSGAAAAMRSAVADPVAAMRSKKELASYKGGRFTVGDFARWTGAFPPPVLAQIKSAPDSALTGFARTLTQNTLLLKEADSAGAQLHPSMYNALILQYRVQVDGVREGVGLDAPELSDTARTSVEQKRELAAKKVEEYFEKLAKGEAQYRQIPPTLSLGLRAEGGYKIYQAGLARVADILGEKRRADSAAGGQPQPGAPQPGTVQPAPGGPPVPPGSGTP